MRTHTMVAAAIVLMLGVGCGDDPSAPDPQLPLGVNWKLVGFGERSSDVLLIPDDAEYFVRFESDQTILGANACNACEGSFETGSKASLTIAPTCTQAACGVPPPWLGYADALASVTSFSIVDGRLLLYYTNRDGEPWVLVHSKAP